MINERNYAICDDLNNVQLKLLECGHAIENGAHWVGNEISPPFSRLYYIADGDPYIISDGHIKPLEPGKCYLIPTGYSFRHACKTSMEQLYFHLNLIDFNEIDLLHSIDRVIECTTGVEKIRQLIGYSKSGDLNSELLLRQEITASILQMVADNGIHLRTAHYSRCVLLAMEYIKKHVSLRLGISELAEHAFVSESTLSKKFKNEIGITIGSYIDERVMLETERLLLKSDLTVLQISERYGFCDQFYFSRRFKAKYGETPQKYRKNRLP